MFTEHYVTWEILLFQAKVFGIPRYVMISIQSPSFLKMPELLNVSIHLFVWFIRAVRRFQQSFSHIATVSGRGRELNAHF